MSLFSEFQLSPALLNRLAATEIISPTPIQSQAIPALLAGRDVVGQASTGSGKTLAYALPLLQACYPKHRGVQALVIVPTRELAVQVGGVLASLAGQSGVRVALLYGGRPIRAQQLALARGDQVVVATPGRLLDHLKQKSISLSGVRYLVLDEADEMLDQGFGPDVERILAQTPPGRQTSLFSATLPAWVQRTAARHLHDPLTIMLGTEAQDRPAIEQMVYEVNEKDKPQVLRRLIDRQVQGSTIVFGRTKHRVKHMAIQLASEGYRAAALQGNMSQNARERVIADFRAGRVQVLLATNVAARGLDLEDVNLVINYELPESAEWFTHRAGRTGRMGKTGQAVTLLEPTDLGKWRQIERVLEQRFPRHSWETGLPVAEPAQPAVTAARVNAGSSQKRYSGPFRRPRS